MPLCVGVSFKRVARSFWFDPNNLNLKEEDRVIVETTHGPELGTVRIAPQDVPEDELLGALKRVLRFAEHEDFLQDRSNRELAKQALAVCQERVSTLRLNMRLLQAEYCFDASQVTIYFASDSRVDFRELVRDVAAQTRCKVLMHQVGPRDQAKMIGGIGPCGLTLCCATFLTEFAPVSMKMAKDQSLFVNPVKFSGVCGKLMCCLRYEYDEGTEAKPILPQIGEIVMSPVGQGKVLDLNLKTEVALVQIFEDKSEQEFPCASLRIEKVAKCADCRGCKVEKMKEDAESTVTMTDEIRRNAERIAQERAANPTNYLFEEEQDADI